MKRSLRRTSAGVSVTYSNEGYSHNLIGTTFCYDDESDGVIKVSIDLSCNLRVRNREQNRFYDADYLAENHTLLKSLRISDQQIIDRLNRINRTHPDVAWNLEISLGDKGVFKYVVLVSSSNGSVSFNIKEIITNFCT